MSADVVILLVSYWVLLAAGLLWIALDAETAYIFDVFGKNFDYMWWHSGHRWKITFMYGWRLLAVTLLIAVCAYMAWLLASAASNGRAGTLLLFGTLSFIPLCLLPWINFANRKRFQLFLRNTAKQLTPVAQYIATNPNVSAMLDDADYRTDPDWSVWHPKSIDDWPAIVPVAYAHARPAATVLFPVDWENFLAWKLGDQLPTPGSVLPFNGPGDSTFTLLSVSPLRGVPDWSLVHADFQLDNETTEGA